MKSKISAYDRGPKNKRWGERTVNFLKETLEILKKNKKSETDVIWVGYNTEKTSWENFKKLANFEYDNGYANLTINLDFIIVGKDWWLERHEYDGSEWWEFKSLPKIPKRNNDNLNIYDKYFKIDKNCMRYKCDSILIVKPYSIFDLDRPLFCPACWENVYFYRDYLISKHPEQSRQELEKEAIIKYITPIKDEKGK